MSDEILNQPAANTETPAATPAPQAAVAASASASTPPAPTTKAEIVAALKAKNAERAAAAAAKATETQADNAPVVNDTPASDTAATTGASDQTQSKFDEDTVAMAAAYGVPLDGFADDASARNAVKLIAERYAIEQPTYVENEVEEDEEEGFDKSALDAPTAAYIKKLEQEVAQSQRQLQEIREAQEQIERQNIDRLWSDTTKRAVALVDSLAHPALGTSGKTTPLQNAAREAVFKTTGRLLNGFLREGREAPAIEVVLRTALELNGIPSKKPVTPAAKSLPPGATAAVPAKQLKLPTIKKPHDPLGIMQDETFRRGVAEIFAGRS